MKCKVKTSWVRVVAAAFIALGCGLLLGAPTTVAQELPEAERTVDKAGRAEIIDSVLTTLNNKYVFPDVAKAMEKEIRARQKKKVYENLTDRAEFCDSLSEDLRAVCHDLHLSVRVAPREMLERVLADTLTDEELKRQLEDAARANYRFEKVERLPGNIGYLKLNGFNGYAEAGPTAIAAMNFLGNCDALIIDLTENGGGSPSMIQIITSYFFDEPTHLNTFYLRESDSLRQFWTTNNVSGPRMSDVDLYVLTSGRTFSAAEEFTYNLKNLERATIVGETTGGGAHPVNRIGFPSLSFGMSVPIGRAINPITGTNWEGTGIEPHIACAVDQALPTARIEALKKLRDKATDEERKQSLAWQVEWLEALMNPTELSQATMQAYVGSYGPRKILLEDGKLYYQREDRPKVLMIPMNEDTFCYEDIEYFRLKVITGDNGAVIAVEGHYDNGRVDRNARE